MITTQTIEPTELQKMFRMRQQLRVTIAQIRNAQCEHNGPKEFLMALKTAIQLHGECAALVEVVQAMPKQANDFCRLVQYDAHALVLSAKVETVLMLTESYPTE